MARLSEHGIRLSSMSPSFLNSNSTSHTWPFSAVAELIDNASDPGVSAKQIWIDAVEEVGQLCLTFTDNGSGMTPNKLHKMLSFGFTEKGSGKGRLQAIGVYGNGFKSGSMRLGRDALIFTKNGGCQTVGMLSQTYLENIKAEAVIVPIVPFNQQTKSLVMTEDSEASLAAILQNSIVSSVEKIHGHFDSMPSKKGTKILIWNIRKAKDGKPEMDFETDVYDFRLPPMEMEELKKGLRSSGSLRAEENIPEMHYSLRAYLSILYLKPRTQIILRGKKNMARLVSRSLTHIEHDVYKPHFSKEKVKVTFGLTSKHKDHYGIMMYHKNRLIKAYEKVGCQLKSSGQRAGVGVIGIIECNFLKPAHNKQDFEYTKEYRLTLSALGLKLNDYWREVKEKRAREREFQAVDRDENEHHEGDVTGPMWLQCEECLKWRSVNSGLYSEVPESWSCSQNPNPRLRSCSLPEEEEDGEELLTPSYQKNHKKQEHLKIRRRENSLEVCTFQDQVAKPQMLSRSSSEPGPSSFLSIHTMGAGTQCHAGEKTPEPGPGDMYTGKHTNKDSCTQTLIPVLPTHTHKKEGSSHRLEDKEEEAIMESTPGEEESTDTPSRKRKSEEIHSWRKKSSVCDEPQPEPVMKPESQSRDTASRQASRSRAEKAGELTQQWSLGGLSSLPRPHPLPTAQTVMVSPLSRTAPLCSRPLTLEGSSRDASLHKLAGLEKESQRLRRLLGLESTKTSQGTMTWRDCSEVSCQTEGAESSTSPSSSALTPGLLGEEAQAQKEACEQRKPRKEKTEAQSRRGGESEACEDRRSPQERLHDIRNNVVVLLTALLPQLDLTGISVEGSDVDSILQQIIDVNSLKL